MRTMITVETSLILLTTSEFASRFERRHLTIYPLASQDESSEQFVGEWAENRGIRDELFIATKVCFSFSQLGSRGSDSTPVHDEL